MRLTRRAFIFTVIGGLALFGLAALWALNPLNAAGERSKGPAAKGESAGQAQKGESPGQAQKGEATSQAKKSEPASDEDLAELPSVAPIAAKAQSAVINLVVRRPMPRREPGGLPEPGGPPLPLLPSPIPVPGGQEIAQGSGFLYDPEGYIITNNHLVEGAEEILINLDDGKELKAEIVGRDPKTDLALIKLAKPGPYPYLALGDSDQVKIGDWLIAIGNPFGLERTVTLGILSARGRAIGAGPYDDFLQTDASINPGSSGGPLLSLQGEVVGVNAKITSRAAGIGFAIPSKIVAKIIVQLKTKGYVERGWLGVSIQAMSEDMAKLFGLDSAQGALVSDVLSDTPAEKAGLAHGDVVVEFDGQPVKEFGDLSALVADSPPGKVLKLVVVRDKKKKTIDVTLERMEDDAGALGVGGPLDLGLTFKPISLEMAKDLGTEAGLLVEKVAPESPAQLAGVATRDIILEIDRQPVTTFDDYIKSLRAHDKTTPILLFVKRGERTIFLAVGVEK